jgi:hypothetical protein
MEGNTGDNKTSKRKRVKQFIKNSLRRIKDVFTRKRNPQTVPPSSTQPITEEQEQAPTQHTVDDRQRSLQEDSDNSLPNDATKESTLIMPGIAVPPTESEDEVSDSPSTEVSRRSATTTKVDLSGEWIVVASDDFKDEYEKFLILLGQPSVVRSFALSLVGFTTEEVSQTDKGRSLVIRGRNVRGEWGRTLIASSDDEPEFQSILTADGEQVTAENWWEDGTLHRSWIRGVKKFGGGDFENVRYLDRDGFFICDTTFHPYEPDREQANITWKFKRANKE